MSRWSYFEYLIAAIAVIFGWTVVADQLRTDGWGAGAGWLLGFASIATVGLGLLTFARLVGPRHWAWIGLALVAASPVVYFYPLSIAVVLLTLIELIALLRARRASAAVSTVGAFSEPGVDQKA
jgi:hypothetical protein